MVAGATTNAETDGLLEVQHGAAALRWFYRGQPVLDYGVDAHLEVVSEDWGVSGRNLALQVKGGSSHFDRPTIDGSGWTFSGSLDHLSYWLGHSLPVVVVIVDADGQAFWQQVTTETVTENPAGFTLVVPRMQRFDVTAREALTDIAGSNVGVRESLPGRYERLPPDVCVALRRAETADVLATARLAERLDTGRFEPAMTVELLTAARPTWLVYSPAAQDLWLAVGSYAAEHGRSRVAAPAFRAAADADGPRGARALAFAGLTLIWDSTEDARELLLAARAGGAVLLADAGLALLDVPVGDGRHVSTPATLLNATDAELDAEPAVLNYLGEMAVRRGDLDEAVDLLDRAVRASTGGRSSGVRVGLARALFRRLTDRGSRSPVELRRAIGHARAAVEERRRWDGPSAEALETLMEILFIADEAPEAVAEGLPRSAGGRAPEREPRRPGVARVGATASLASHDDDSFDVFLGLLGDGPERLEVLALRRQMQGPQPPEEEVATWTGLFADAVDDAAAARFLARLARLGVWPDGADDLRGRSVMTADSCATLLALFVAQSGDPTRGAAELRTLAARGPAAAVTFVDVLQEHVGVDEATRECRAQLDRWGDPMLLIRLLGLLRLQGQVEEAEEIADGLVTDETLSVPARLRMTAWLVDHRHRRRDLAGAVSAARRGLAVAEDPDLAWNLVACLAEAGETAEARAALSRHRPEPATERETRLWAELHVGENLTVRDAAVLADLVRRQPPGALRAHMAGMLAREVLHSPDSGPYPEALRDEARDLEAQEAGSRPDGPDQAGGTGPAGTAEQRVGTLIAGVRLGTTAVADVAARTGRRYGSTLLHRQAGVLVAADWRAAGRADGEAAAREALHAGATVVDLSAILVLSGLPPEMAAGLTDPVGARTTTLATRLDVAYTVDDARSAVAAAADTLAGGTDEATRESAVDATALLRAATALRSTCDLVPTAVPMGGDDREPSASVLELALRTGLTVWADDIALRGRACAAGVRAFGSVDLLAALGPENADAPDREVLVALARAYLADLPLSAGDLVTLGVSHEWAVGPAHLALSRRGWWLARPHTWTADWETVAFAAAAAPGDALNTATLAAARGAVSAAPPALAGMRLRLVLTAAAAAEATRGCATDPGVVDWMRTYVQPGVMPDDAELRTAAAAVLRRRGLGPIRRTAMPRSSG